MLLDGVRLVITFIDSLAQYATQFVSHLPISLSNTISLAKNTTLKIIRPVLLLSETLVLVVARIYRLCHNGAAHPNLPNDVDAIPIPRPADPPHDANPQSIPCHDSQAESTDPNPPPPNSNPALGVTHTGNFDALSVDEHPQAMPQISALLLYMATSLLERYVKERRTMDLVVSIDVLDVAKGLPASSRPHRSNTINTLAIAWFIRYSRSCKGLDLSKAIAFHREALDLLLPDEPAHSSSPTILKNAALAWCRQHGGDVDAFDFIGAPHSPHNTQSPGYEIQFPTAEGESRPTSSSPSNGPHQPVPQAATFLHDTAVSDKESTMSPEIKDSVEHMAVSCQQRYPGEDGLAWLDNHIGVFQQVLAVQPPDDPNRPVNLTLLARALLTRHQHNGGEHDFSQAIELLREGLSLRPPGHPGRANSLRYLALTISQGCQPGADERELSEVIELFREALTLHPPGHPDYSTLLEHLATIVLMRDKVDMGGDVSEGIELLRGGLALHPPGHPSRSRFLGPLARALSQHYQSGNGDTNLSEVIELCREILALHPLGHPDRSSALDHLGSAILRRCVQTRDKRDLSECIILLKEALNLTPPGHPERAASLKHLAVAFIGRDERDGRDVSEGITLLREALALHPPGHADRSSYLGFLAQACREVGDERNLSECIILFREALTLHPPGHRDRSGSLSNLIEVISRRYQRYGDEEDLSELIELCKEELMLHPPGHPSRPRSLYNLAGSLFRRYRQDGRQSDLSKVIDLGREAVTLYPPGHPNRADSLSGLAEALYTRYEQGGDKSDLSMVIELHEEALASRPAGHPDRSTSLSNLARAIVLRYEREGSEPDLSEGVRLFKEALGLRPPGHPNRPQSLNNVASILHRRFGRDGEQSDLSQAVDMHRQALAFHPTGHPDRSDTLYGLASAICTRYERDGNRSDLWEAIELHEEALALYPIGHRNRPISLHNLALAVFWRYKREGKDSDMLKAVELERESLILHPPGHPGRSISLSFLGGMLLIRYTRDGEEVDLSEGIELQSEAITLNPPGHPLRPTSLSNFAYSIFLRYMRDGSEQDLLRCIEVLREASSLHVPGEPNRSVSLHNLAAVLVTRHVKSGGRSDLLEAIELHKQVLALLPSGHHSRLASLVAIAAAYRCKCLLDRDVLSLAVAFKYQQEAFDIQPVDHPLWSDVASTLAEYLFEISKLLGDLPPVEKITNLLRNAVATGTSSIAHRLRAALCWVRIATEIDPESVLEAYRSALTLLGSAVALGRSLQARHNSLLSQRPRSQPIKGLGLDAALWALTGPSPDAKLAIEFLDQGRNVLLASVGQFRPDLSDVRWKDAALADEFYRTSRVLESTILTGQEISQGQSSYEDLTSRYKRISADWEAVVAKIRLLPGCESFLLPVPFKELQEAALGGPVIVILVGKERSTAIIVTSKGEPRTVDLPKASEKALETLHRDMDTELGAPVRPDIREVLSDLWKIVVQPIIQELQDVLLIPTGSRIWWYPTSWASFLPLHAAGSYTKGGLNVPKLYISSYTPTLQSLRRSRHRFIASSNQTTSLLIVSQAQTPGQIALPSVDDEVGVVLSLAPDASLLSDDQGTKENMLRQLHNHSWIHLACHGIPNPSDPFQSHFALHDGPLSLQDIITNDLPSADFAYLAACHSAAQDRTLPDEGLTLAGGMQFAGFKSVVGTMRAMADVDAPIWAEEFYRGLAMRSGEGKPFDCTKAAESLHDAVKELRKKKVPMFRWINLVHYGV